MSATAAITTRHNWSLAEVRALFEQPFNDLLFQAQSVHRQHFDPNRVQVSTLLSIKTGACPEDCKYCPQSGHYNTGLDKEKLMEVQKVLEAAAEAKAIGSTRFCMGAAWKHPSAKDMPYVLKMVEGVKAMGLETCMTLGMLTPRQAEMLAELERRLPELGLPEGIVHRQPFPGPGLGIRIIGEVTEERLETLRAADAIAREELTKAGMDDEIWQCPVVLLADVRSVGVQGDGRTYGHPIVLRPVASEDAMTADWVRIPYETLEVISTRITNEVADINRVVLDVTSKPPATIEWE